MLTRHQNPNDWDTSDPEKVKQSQEDLDRLMAERNNVMINLMSTTQGRRWVYDFLNQTHIFSTAFTPGPDGARFTDFKLGEQNVGLKLYAALETACPELCSQMIEEANHAF